MKAFHCLEFFVYSLCVHLFSLFIYVCFYTSLIFSNYRNEIQQEYDYIIVGAGTAGSLIAHRIATETNYTYLLLEAGGHGNSIFDIPVLGPLLHGSVYDWQYETVPQRHACFAMKDKKCKMPQGRLVGGSSRLNNMIHIRGNLSHYTHWFRGKYSEEYIEKQLNFIEENIIHLSDIKYQSKLADSVIEAAVEMGFGQAHNKEFSSGFMKSTVSQKNGKRWSTSNNIENSRHLVTNAVVHKVFINDNKATGVSFEVNRKSMQINVSKGVIISAGTYNSPKILQLSGIGPKNLLKSLGISIVKDLPVGENLQDHVTTGLDLIQFVNSLDIGAADLLNPYNLLQYFLNNQGPLTTPGCEVIGFLSTKNISVPDIQFMVLPVGIASDRGSHLRNTIGLKDEVWKGYFEKSFHKYTATILPIVLHPKSRGTVYITSKSLDTAPSIDPKYLSNHEDVDTLIKGLKLVMEFVNTRAMKEIGAKINPTPFPGCEEFHLFSDEYFACYIKHLTLTSYHPVGTCSMGSPESKQSVVDTNFNVVGIESLYVVDGSVLPTLPSCNINAAVAMMASIFVDAVIKKPNNLNNVNTCRSMFRDYFKPVCLPWDILRPGVGTNCGR